MEKLLTAKDIKELLQVPLSWVWREAREGRLPIVPNLGRKKRFDKRTIEKLYFTEASCSLTIKRNRVP